MRETAGSVTIGRVVRPQGNRGEVVVAPETDYAEHRFVPGAVFEVYGREDEAPRRRLTVRESRPHDARWVVGFEGVDSIDAAETLRDLELRIPDSDLTPLGPGRYYLHDLVGCQVVAGDEPVGEVERVDLETGTAVLVVRAPAYGEVLVPLAEEICRRIDVPARRIEIAPPAGLLDLNAPRARAGAPPPARGGRRDG